MNRKRTLLVGVARPKNKFKGHEFFVGSSKIRNKQIESKIDFLRRQISLQKKKQKSPLRGKFTLSSSLDQKQNRPITATELNLHNSFDRATGHYWRLGYHNKQNILNEFMAKKKKEMFNTLFEGRNDKVMKKGNSEFNILDIKTSTLSGTHTSFRNHLNKRSNKKKAPSQRFTLDKEQKNLREKVFRITKKETNSLIDLINSKTIVDGSSTNEDEIPTQERLRSSSIDFSKPLIPRLDFSQLQRTRARTSYFLQD